MLCYLSMNNPSQVTIPAALIPEFEAWGRLTVKLFSQLRQQPTTDTVKTANFFSLTAELQRAVTDMPEPELDQLIDEAIRFARRSPSAAPV